MVVIFSYIFLGLSLAAPIGPVNAAQLDKGIKNGFLHAWLVGIGATLADAIYMFMVYFGVVHFLDLPFMQTFLWLFGFFVLLYTGIESLLGAQQLELNHSRSKDSYMRCFMTGFFMSLFSPLTALFWLGVFGSVLAKTASTYDTGQIILYSSFIFVGITIWDITMASLSSSFRHYLTNKPLMWISMLSGLSLIGFGLYFGYQALLMFI